MTIAELEIEAGYRWRRMREPTKDPVVNERERESDAKIQQEFIDAQTRGEVTSLVERLAQPWSQPKMCQHLLPRRRCLASKLSRRCGTCDKFVIKPVANPASSKFAKSCLFLGMLPHIKLSPVQPLCVGQATSCVLFLRNVLGSAVRVRIQRSDSVQFSNENFAWGIAGTKHDAIEVRLDAYDDMDHDMDQGGLSTSPLPSDPKGVVYRNLSEIGICFEATVSSPCDRVVVPLHIEVNVEQKGIWGLDALEYDAFVWFGQAK